MRRLFPGAAAASLGLFLSGAAGALPARTAPVFFFAHGALTRVSLPVTGPGSAGEAAVRRLLAGPPRGYRTAIPSGVRIVALSAGGGRARATFSRALGAPSRSAQGQLVSTIAASTGAARVVIAVQGAGAATLRGGDGRRLTGGARVSDYVDLTAAALIFVRSPPRGATVTSPVRLSGTANTFEATFQIEVRSRGRAVGSHTVTATSGTGTRGTWSAVLALPHGDVTLVLYEASAKDGSRIHMTQVPLHVR